VPRHPPEEEYLHDWIRLMIVVALWAIWLLLLVLVGLHVRATVGRIRIRRLQMANPPEGFAAGLLGAVVVAFTTAGSRGTISTPPAPPVVDMPIGLMVQPSPGTQPGAAAATQARPTAGKPEPAAAAGQPGGETNSAGQAPQVTHGPNQAWGRVEPASGVDPVQGASVERDVSAGGDAGETAGTDPDWTHWAQPQIGADGGVELPDGGWVDRHTAAAVNAAAGLVWLRRRRRYVPRPPSGSRRRDADLTALPDTVAAIVDGLHRDRPDPTQPQHDGLGDAVDQHARTEGDLAQHDRAQDDRAQDDRAQDDRASDGGHWPGQGEEWTDRPLSPPTRAAATVAALGQAQGGPLRPADLPASGVGLTGPGAADAARGILTAALLSGGSGYAGLDTQVLTTAADLSRLLHPGLVGHAQPGGLNVFAGLEELMAQAETQLLDRRHLPSAAQPAADVTGPIDAAVESGPFPPLLIVTAAPVDVRQARRLAVLLTHTPGRLGVRGAVLGGWPLGATWQVDLDGTVRPDTIEPDGVFAPGSVGPDAIQLGTIERGSVVEPATISEPAGIVGPGTMGLAGHAIANGRRPAVAAGVRLCVLSATAATDLLTLQAQARPGRFQLHQTNEPPWASGQAPPDTRPVGTATDADAHPDADRRSSPSTGRPTSVDTVPTAGDRYGGAPDTPLRLRLLGGAELRRTGDVGSPLQLGRSAALQVLVFLALHPHGATSHDLAAALWPGIRPRPTDRVYTAASTLRATFARVTDVEILTRKDERYQLNRDLLEVDLWTLHAAVDLAAVARDPATRAEALRAIIRCYTGELAARYLWSWIRPYREATRRHVIDAYTALADITLADSTVAGNIPADITPEGSISAASIRADSADPSAVVALLRDALRVEPANEDLHRRVAAAVAAAGRPTVASTGLAGYLRHLALVGEEPEPATRALAERLAGDHPGSNHRQ
jgi:DNA-binding SARP family transcriptional activator